MNEVSKMTVFLWIVLIFWAGAAFERWDAKHGYETGMRLGTWTRVHIFRLPPIE